MNDDVLEMLANSATTFAKSDPDRARRFRGQSTGFDRQAWRNIASQGWLSVLIPEERNGLGLGVAAAAVIARVLGRASLPEPFVATGVLAMACMGASESSEPWRSRLAQIMSGDSIVSVAWQDDRGSIDIGHSGVTGIKSKLGYELTGASRFVAVPRADAFIVYATGEDALVWVPADAPGLEVRLECCPDGSALAWLQFRQVTLPAEARLSRAGEASSILRTALDAALVANAAELLGIMDGALDMTLKYLRTRKQFGVPIGSYQSLQHRAVDLWIARELSEAAIHGAARTLDDPTSSADQRTAAASGAKARAAQSALMLCNQALQLHGAIGFADEYGLGLYLNRALTLSAWLGNAAQHRRRFGDLAMLDAREASQRRVVA